MSKRPRYDPAGPMCSWCGDPCGKDNPSRTFFSPDDPSFAMTPVCGEDCPNRPGGDAGFVFAYFPPTGTISVV